MTFGESVFSCLKGYFRFDGRSPRSEFWYWHLFVALVRLAALVTEIGLHGVHECATRGPGCSRLPEFISAMVFLIPSIAVDVRRMHDVGRSGWWLLTILPPVYWAFIPGTAGPNRFGPDPLPLGGA